MKSSYSIEEERMIAERSRLIVRGLTLGIVSDDEAKEDSFGSVRLLCSAGRTGCRHPEDDGK